MLLTIPSGGIEVKEPRYSVQFLFEYEDALVLDDVANLAVGVEDIAELPGAHRADLDASGVAAFAAALDAEGALLDDALWPRPVAEVVGVGVQFVCRNRRLNPVEVACAVRARSHAV